MKTVRVFISSIMAGVCIALGGTVFLSVENGIVGALLFTIGLFTICTMGFSLFTGRVCYFMGGGVKRIAELALIWAGNFAGTWMCARLLTLTRNVGIIGRAEKICEVKLSDELLSVFVLAVFCNMLIYIAVESFNRNPHELGKYLALFFGVSTFILCGFEHCIANMFFISLAGMWGKRAMIFILVCTAGNSLGGLLIPAARRVIDKV